MSEEKEPQTLHQLKQRQTRELKALKGAPLPKNKTHGSKGAKKDRKLALAAMDARHKEEIAEFQANGPKKSAVGDEGGEGEAVVDANPEVDEKASASQAVKADNDAAAAASKPSFSSTTATATATSPASSCCSASACAAQSAQELPKYASKKAKALAKKQRQHVREKEEEAKLEAEIALLEDKKGVELKALQAILAPKGLTFKQIKADGHCLYRSVSDQLSKQPEQKQYSWEQLRTLAAATLRANEATYAPFLFAEKDDVDFELYCEELEHGTRDGKVVWGGQVELIALSRALGTPILVYNAKNQEAIDSSTEGDDRRGGESTPLLLTFHEHYFGLGAHYNSCEAVM